MGPSGASRQSAGILRPGVKLRSAGKSRAKSVPKEVLAWLADAVEVSAMRTERIGTVFIIAVKRKMTDREEM